MSAGTASCQGRGGTGGAHVQVLDSAGTVGAARRRSRAGAVGAAALVAALLVVLAPPGAQAARPTVLTSTSLGLACSERTATGVVDVGATAGGDGTAFVALRPLDSEPGDAPVLVAPEMRTLLVGSVLTAEGPVLDGDGKEVGTGALRLELVFGDVEQIREREQTGNRGTRVTGSRSIVSAAGTVTLAGTSYAVSGCAGTRTELRQWFSAPDSIVGSGQSAVIDCVLTREDGWEMEIYGNAMTVDFFVHAPETGDVVLDGFVHRDDQTALTAAGMLHPFRVHDSRSGELLGDSTGVVRATAVGAPHRIEQVLQGGGVRLAVQDLAMSGELGLPGGLSFSFEGCEAAAVTSRLRIALPAEPDTSRPAPAHDTPEAALALGPGAMDRVDLRTAAPGAEAPTSCLAAGERHQGEIWGRTVWYVFDGTGNEVTLDTAGSTFDSALAVYAVSGDGLTEVGCADDTLVHRYVTVPQARLTVPTDVGVRYLVQAGGVLGEHGRLLLRRN